MANNDEVSIKFSADTKSFTDAVAQVATSYDEAMKKIATASSMSEVQAAMTTATENMGQAIAVVQTNSEAAAKVTGQVSEAMLGLDSSADTAYNRIKSSAEEAAHAGDKVAHSTVGQRREIIVLAHEMLQGNFSRIPGSLMVLADRAGSLNGLFKQMTGIMFGPLGLAIELTAAFAMLAIAFEKGQQEIKNINNALVETSNFSDQTSASVLALSDAISNSSNMSSGAAVQMETDLISSGKIGAAAFDSVSSAIARYSSITGDTASKSAAWGIKIFSDPVKGAKELEAQYHLLTGSEMAHIEQLVQEGKQAEAAAFLSDKYRDSMKGVNAELGFFAGLAKQAKDDWESLTHAMSFFTVEADNTKAGIQGLEGAIAMLEARKKSSGSLNAIDESSLAIDKQRLAFAQAQIGYDKQQAEIKHSTAVNNQASFDAQQIADKVNPALSHERELMLEIKKLQDNVDGKNGPIDPAELDREVAAIQKLQVELDKVEHPKTKKAAAQKSHMGEYAAELEAAKATYIQEHNGREMSKAEEEAFWQQKLALAQGNERDMQAIRTRINAATISDLKSSYKEQTQLAQMATQEQQKIDTDAVNMKMQAVTQAFNMGTISRQQELVQLQAFEDQKTAIAEKGMATRITAMQNDPNHSPVALQKLLDQMQAIQDAAEVKKQDTINKAALASKKQWEGYFAPIASAFDKSISGIIMGTTTMQKALANIGQSIVAEFVNMGVKRVTTWLADEAMMLFATNAKNAAVAASNATGATLAATTKATEATAVVGANAAEGASAAAASVAAVPIVGPGLAIGAFAATMALILGAKSLIHSSAGGEWNVGADRLNFVHRGETILPAHVAAPLRDMVEGGGANGMQIHIHATDAQSVKRLFDQNGKQLVNSLRKQVRAFNTGAKA